jgi:hypothetical protein
VIESLTTEVSESLSSNDAITKLDELLDGIWKDLHTGEFFNTPSVTFTSSDVDALLRHLNIAFDSAPGDEPVLDWTRLSDGQQSLLYLTLVLALQALGAKVIVGDVPMVDAAKLKPASLGASIPLPGQRMRRQSCPRTQPQSARRCTSWTATPPIDWAHRTPQADGLPGRVPTERVSDTEGSSRRPRPTDRICPD